SPGITLSRLPRGMSRRVPRHTTGTTGRPRRMASTKAPFLNSFRRPSRLRVPSGNTTNDCPSARTRLRAATASAELSRSMGTMPSESSTAPTTACRHRLCFATKRVAPGRWPSNARMSRWLWWFGVYTNGPPVATFSPPVTVTRTPSIRSRVRARALAKFQVSRSLPVIRCSPTATAPMPTSMPRKRYGESATRSERVSSAGPTRLAAADRDSVIARRPLAARPPGGNPHRAGSRRVPAVVAIEEVRDAPERVGEQVGVGQEHDPEVIGLRPVEAGALHHEHLLLLQQLEDELLIVGDGIALRIEPREEIHGRLRLDAGHARDAREQVDGEMARPAEPTGR